MRGILHKESVSAFSKWYNYNVPHDRGLTDIDGVVLRRGQLRGFLEHRVNGFVGGEIDNNGQLAVEILADLFGLTFEVCKEFDPVPGALDTRFAIWLVYSNNYPQSHTFLGDISFHQVFSVRGNMTPFGRRSCQASELQAYCQINGIDFRHIELFDNGEPQEEEDRLWLQKNLK